MRNQTHPSVTEVLFPTTRRLLLELVFREPDTWMYLSEYASKLGLRPSSLQEEVAKLTQAGVLSSERHGNRIYYRANRHCSVFPELSGIMLKTSGLVEAVRRQLIPFEDRISLAFIFGSIASGKSKNGSDVDLMIVGSLGLADLALPVRDLEAKLNRSVEPFVLSREEALKGLKEANHFLHTVASSEKIVLIGNDNELESAFSSQT